MCLIFEAASTFHLQLPLSDGLLPRYCHSTTAVELAPGLTEVTFFGGITRFDPKKSPFDQHMVAETMVMSFGKYTCYNIIILILFSGIIIHVLAKSNVSFVHVANMIMPWMLVFRVNKEC